MVHEGEIISNSYDILEQRLRESEERYFRPGTIDVGSTFRIGEVVKRTYELEREAKATYPLQKGEIEMYYSGVREGVRAAGIVQTNAWGESLRL